MSRYSPIRLAHDIRKRMFEEFVRTMASMESTEDFRNLFEDLFTSTEIAMFVRRLHAGHLLLSGYSYKEIKCSLKMSEDTVKNVANRISKNGRGIERASELLKKIIPEIEKETSEAVRAIKPYTFEWLKKTICLLLSRGKYREGGSAMDSRKES